MDLTADRPTLEQIEAMARAQREAREQAQARALEAQRTRQRAEDDVRRALLVEYHLYRAAALAQKQAKPDRFEEAYLQWQTGARTDAADIDALIAAHTEGRTFGILGQPRVNVLLLNMALEDRQ